VNTPVEFLLQLAEGPVFRLAFALLVLGAMRAALLAGSDAVAAYFATPERAAFWRKLRMRVLWQVFPTLVKRERYTGQAGLFAYHMALCVASLVFRLGLVLVPTFMVAHVYLWERGLGVGWPALPANIADAGAVITIIAGFVLFMGRLYSPLLRFYEPAWTFLKPLILIVPFVTGYLAMHPSTCPVDYAVVRLVHVLSASLVFVMIPFARMLTCVHTPLTRVVPEAARDADIPLTQAPALVAGRSQA
jgi:hypothetical protein